MGSRGGVVWRAACLALGLFAAAASDHAAADTMNYALIQAYQNNPQLSAQRAATRASDENVGIQLGGYRPKVSATSSIAEAYLDTLARVPASKNTPFTTYNRATGEN